MSVIQVEHYECDKCGNRSEEIMEEFPLKIQPNLIDHKMHLCSECIPSFLYDICSKNLLLRLGLNAIIDTLPSLSERLGLNYKTPHDKD